MSFPIGMAFDIETIPGPDVLAMEPPIEFLQKGSRSNMSSDKLAEHMKKQELVWPEEKIKLGSLDWRRGEILSFGVGWWERNATTQAMKTVVRVGLAYVPEQLYPVAEWFGGEVPCNIDLEVEQYDCEATMLREFWSLVAQEINRHQVGFCCRDFDCPWLLFRSAVNGVTPSRIWQTGRYTISGRHVDLIDLADILSWQGKFSMAGWSLDEYCKWFDTEWKPRGEGRDVYEHYKNGELVKVVEHQVFDILATMGLYLLVSPAVL